MIDQLTACLPDKPGTLARMCRALGERSIQIHALMVAQTTDFGIVRIICDRPRSAVAVLTSLGYSVQVSRVVAVEVEASTVSIAGVLDRLASSDLNVEYAYGCSIGGRAVNIIRVSGEPLDVKLRDCGLDQLVPAELYALDEQ